MIWDLSEQISVYLHILVLFNSQINTEKNNTPLTTKYISEASLYSVCVKQKEYNPRERDRSTIYSKSYPFLENNYRVSTVTDFQILGHHYCKIHPRFNKRFQREKETLLSTCQFKLHSNGRNAEIWKSIHLRMNEKQPWKFNFIATQFWVFPMEGWPWWSHLGPRARPYNLGIWSNRRALSWSLELVLKVLQK